MSETTEMARMMIARAESDHRRFSDMLAMAPGVILTLCDEADTSERRAVEAERLLEETVPVLAVASTVGRFVEMCRPILYPKDGEPTHRNYASCLVDAGGRLAILTMQMADGKTPADIAAEAVAARDAVERRAVEAEAGAAVMSKALSAVPQFICDTCRTLSQPNDASGPSDWPCFCGTWRNEQSAALATDAGRAYADRLERAEAEREALRAVISECATAIGNGAAVSKHASVEFMAMLPGEIRGVATALRAERDALRVELEKERAEVRRLEGRKSVVCDCADKFNAMRAHGLVSFVAGDSDCPRCSGSGAVIVEGET